MAKTFADRRILVVKKGTTISKLKKLYPALFTEMEVSVPGGTLYKVWRLTT